MSNVAGMQSADRGWLSLKKSFQVAFIDALATTGKWKNILDTEEISLTVHVAKAAGTV